MWHKQKVGKGLVLVLLLPATFKFLIVAEKYLLSSFWTFLFSVAHFKGVLFPQLCYLKRYRLIIVLENITEICEQA
jgi:hypothetical protein